MLEFASRSRAIILTYFYFLYKNIHFNEFNVFALEIGNFLKIRRARIFRPNENRKSHKQTPSSIQLTAKKFEKGQKKTL